MENIDLRYICKIVWDISGVPIRVRRDDQLLFYHSVVSIPIDPIVIYRDELRNVTTEYREKYAK